MTIRCYRLCFGIILHALYVLQNYAFYPVQLRSSISTRLSPDHIIGTRQTKTSILATPEQEYDDDSRSPMGQTDEVPSMDWLTNSLEKKAEESDSANLDMEVSPYMEEHDADADDLGDVPIPTTGISVTDEMEDALQDRFDTQLVPIKGLDTGIRAAQLVSTASSGSFEPVRYIVGLSRYRQPQGDENMKADLHKQETGVSSEKSSKKSQSYVMIDVPPFSEKLATSIRSYMGPDAQLAAILFTSRDGIHYNEAPGVYSTRNPVDLNGWKAAFPDIEVVAYRLDIPRDCRNAITQILDGYGPFALDEKLNDDGHATPTTKHVFVETGRPLTYDEWDLDVSQKVMNLGETPPDDHIVDDNNPTHENEDFSPEATRSREEGKRILAVYSPGHSFGSVSYIFPETRLCCSGFTIPVEDNREEENLGMGGAGPALDCRGYITTSKAGIRRQMESARALIQAYSDRMTVVLPSRGDPLYLDGNADERRENLLELIDDYDRIGQIYEQLGITSSDDGDENFGI